MNNKTPQPLSEEQLREKIELIVFARFYDISAKQRKPIIENLLKLYLQERQAWGEYVIGEDWSAGIFPSVGEPSTIEDNLRAEQRKRNNQKEKSDETINHQPSSRSNPGAA